MKKAFLAKGVYSGGNEVLDTGFVVDGSMIVDVVSNSQIKSEVVDAEKIYLDGFVYPSAIDSHVHLKELAFSIISLDASQVKSFKELIELINSSKDNPAYIYNLDFNYITDEEWLKLFNEKRRLFVQSKDVHSVFVSKVFLDESKIFPKEVSGGELKYFSGVFVGVFKDRAADIVFSLKDREFKKDYFKLIDEYFLERGITAVVNFDCDMLKILQQSKEDFKIRVVQAIHKDDVFDAVRNGMRTGDGDGKLKIGPVKLFIDGSLGSQTAFMFYRRPFKGLLLMSETELEDRVSFANENGLQVAVHAIGSGATYIAMKVFKNLGRRNILNRIEHLQFIELEHLDLLRESHFIASMQPVHAISDYELYMKYMGGFKLAYAWNTVRKYGKTLIFGSDTPVDDASFIKGVHAATKRTTLDSGLGYLFEETVDVGSAINAYTFDGYRANYFGNEFGEIASGKKADFIVLKNSLFGHEKRKGLHLFDVGRTKNAVLKTFMEGNEIWTK